SMKSTSLNHFTFLILSKPDVLFLKGVRQIRGSRDDQGSPLDKCVNGNIFLCTDTLSVRVSPGYNNRVEFYKGNFSLLLKNIQEGDSGPYTAVVSGDKENTIIVHQLVLQGIVEPPVLTLDSNSTINGNCNVTVTCRGQKTSVTSSCNSSTCSQVGGESRGAETSTVPLLSVYVAGGSIICNHSNQVSWANDTKEIVELCPMKSDILNTVCLMYTECTKH
uniref:Uncharacterized protein n=1 Tax=Oncorhynchus tshawytscha TaxID=74940 RepID=A0AAZ3QWZ7_ONCTS